MWLFGRLLFVHWLAGARPKGSKRVADLTFFLASLVVRVTNRVFLDQPKNGQFAPQFIADLLYDPFRPMNGKERLIDCHGSDFTTCVHLSRYVPFPARGSVNFRI